MSKTVRTNVVTGSASGMGKATADLLRSRGERVIGVDLHDAEIIADLSTEAGCQQMADAVAAMAPEGIDGLVANAGVLGPTELCYSVNYHGMVRTLELLRPLLAKSSAPRAVATASVAAAGQRNMDLIQALEEGQDPGPAEEGSAYTASKHGVARFVKRMSVTPEWAGAGIMLNAIGPGPISTPMLGLAKEREDVQMLLKYIPMVRPGAPEEIAEVFAFLVSKANSYMTGQVIYVDGGHVALIKPEEY